MTLAAQRRADIQNDNFVTADEWTAMSECASCQHLWDKLIEAYGNDYEIANPTGPYQFTTDGQSDHFALPDGTTSFLTPTGAAAPAFYKMLGVDLQISNAGASTNTGWITLRRFNFADRNKYTLPNVQTLFGRTNLIVPPERELHLWFIPLPASAMPAAALVRPALHSAGPLERHLRWH